MPGVPGPQKFIPYQDGLVIKARQWLEKEMVMWKSLFYQRLVK